MNAWPTENDGSPFSESVREAYSSIEKHSLPIPLPCPHLAVNGNILPQVHRDIFAC